ncbi:hypothetical protein DFJ74DRAFT_147220 [Hyaloraphidium curvatum]|nr:hypothetical protein DFJ74DRAFT_147220 [Hyaloraphidium curvatum]
MLLRRWLLPRELSELVPRFASVQLSGKHRESRLVQPACHFTLSAAAEAGRDERADEASFPRRNRVDQLRAAVSSRNWPLAAALYGSVSSTASEVLLLREADYVALLRLYADQASGGWLHTWTRGWRTASSKANFHGSVTCARIMDDMAGRGLLPGHKEPQRVASFPTGVVEELAERIVRDLALRGKPGLAAAESFISELEKLVSDKALAKSRHLLFRELGRSGDEVGAVRLYKALHTRGLAMAPETHAACIRVASSLNDVALARRAWENAGPALRGQQRIEAWNLLLLVMSRNGKFQNAMDLLLAAASGKDSTLVPNLNSFRNVIAYSPSITSSMALFTAMLDMDCEPDLDVLRFVVRDWVRAGNASEALRLAATMGQSFGVEPDESVYLTIYKELAHLRDSAGMQRVLSQMDSMGIEPRSGFYAHALKDFVEDGNADGVLQTLATMERYNVQKDPAIFRQLALHYMNRWDLDRLDSLVVEARGSQPALDKEPSFGRTLARGYLSRLEEVDDASPRLAELRHQLGDTSRLHVSGRKALALASCVPDSSRAFAAFRKLKEHDIVSWNWLIAAHLWAGDLEQADRILAQMRERGSGPDAWTWSLLVESRADDDPTAAERAFAQLIALRDACVGDRDRRRWADRVGYAAGILAIRATEHRRSGAHEQLFGHLKSSGALHIVSANVVLAIERIAVGLIAHGESHVLAALQAEPGVTPLILGAVRRVVDSSRRDE